MPRAEACLSQDVKWKGADRLGWLWVQVCGGMAPTGLLFECSFWTKIVNIEVCLRKTLCKGADCTVHQQKQRLQCRAGFTDSNSSQCFPRNVFFFYAFPNGPCFSRVYYLVSPWEGSLYVASSSNKPMSNLWCPWTENLSQITSQHGKKWSSSGFCSWRWFFCFGYKASIVWLPSYSGVFCTHLLRPRVVSPGVHGLVFLLEQSSWFALISPLTIYKGQCQLPANLHL